MPDIGRERNDQITDELSRCDFFVQQNEYASAWLDLSKFATQFLIISDINPVDICEN